MSKFAMAATSGVPAKSSANETFPEDSPVSNKLIVLMFNLAILPTPECCGLFSPLGVEEPVKMKSPLALLLSIANRAASQI